MEPDKSGVKTSELWTTIATIAGLLGAVLPVVITYLPPNGRVYAIISIVLAVAVAVYGYAKSRGDVKSSALDALARVNVAKIEAGTAADPPKPPAPQG